MRKIVKMISIATMAFILSGCGNADVAEDATVLTITPVAGGVGLATANGDEEVKQTVALTTVTPITDVTEVTEVVEKNDEVESDYTITVEPVNPETIITEVPEVTEEPEKVEEVEVEETDASTEEPSVTESPEITEEPKEEVEETTASVEAPEVEEKEEEVIQSTAIPTKKPKATVTPKPTKKPEATATPKPTDKPEPTEAPKQTANREGLQSWQTRAIEASAEVEFRNYRIEYNRWGEEVTIYTGDSGKGIKSLEGKYNLPIKGGVYTSTNDYLADWRDWMDMNGRHKENQLYYDLDGKLVYEINSDDNLGWGYRDYNEDEGYTLEFTVNFNEDGTMFQENKTKGWFKVPTMTDSVDEIKKQIVALRDEQLWDDSYGWMSTGLMRFTRDDFNRATDYYTGATAYYKANENDVKPIRVTSHFTIDLIYFWEVLGYDNYFDTVVDFIAAGEKLNAVLTAWNEVVTSTDFYALEGKYGIDERLTPEMVIHGQGPEELQKAYKSHCEVREDFWNNYNK